MTAEEREVVIIRQKMLMNEYKKWEDIQTTFSNSLVLYKVCQNRLDAIDLEADRLRQMLEMEGAE